MQGAPQCAHEFFSEEECVGSLTCRELLVVLRYVQSIVGLCEGKFGVFQVGAQYLLGVVNRGSPRLKLNELARELFCFGHEHGITLNVEWVPMSTSFRPGRTTIATDSIRCIRDVVRRG